MKLMKLIKIGLIILLLLLVSYQVILNKNTQTNHGNVPLINSDVEEIQIPCQYEKEDLLQGLSAYDVEDGDITEKILIGGFSDFTERGVSSLEYAVYDKDGNIATFNRKVVFSDYTPPKISVSDPCVFKPTEDTYNIPSLNLVGWDKLDGDVTKYILITDTDVDFSEPGKYTASVHLKNNFGDEVSMDLPIHVLDYGQNGYTIELKEPLIYVDKGDAVNPEDYIAAIRNEYTSKIAPVEDYILTINSNVDTSVDGIYEIQFSAISLDELQRGETWMTVVVGDYGG